MKKMLTLQIIFLIAFVTTSISLLMLVWHISINENEGFSASISKKIKNHYHMLLEDTSRFNKRALPNYNIRQHGKYWILHNYVSPINVIFGNMSITLTTHGEYNNLDVFENLIKVWRAPISIALLANGDDFEETLTAIRYFYFCSEQWELVQKYINFNLCFHDEHAPIYVPRTDHDIFMKPINCARTPFDRMKNKSYTEKENLEYPINLLRNVARQTALTHFVFPLELGLFPSAKFVDNFFYLLSFIKIPEPLKSVYCLPIFEFEKFDIIPVTKKELLEFQGIENVSKIFRIGNFKIEDEWNWVSRVIKKPIDIYLITKRDILWQTYCVAINKELPMFDERILLSSMYYKMAENDLLMQLDYNFVFLDGAFLSFVSNSSVFDKFSGGRIQGKEVFPPDRMRYIIYMEQLRRLYDDEKPNVGKI